MRSRYLGWTALVLGGLTLVACSEGGTVVGDTTSSQDAAPAPSDSSDAAPPPASTSMDASTTDAAIDAGDAGDAAPGQPALMSLALAPLTLSPAFSPDVHDYTVPCAAGGNTLTVSVTATPGATIRAGTATAAAAPVTSGYTTTVDDDDALVFTATDGATSSPEYWVRCLPPDFPTISFRLHPDAGTPTPGLYLTANGTTATGESNFAMVLNGQGTPIWYERAPNSGVSNVNCQADGSISFFSGPNTAYGMDPTAMDYIQTLAPSKVRTVQTVEGPTDGHEFQLLSNGDALLFTYPQLAGIDLTGLTGYGANWTIADPTIEEIDPTGALVWSWRAVDHIDPVKESIGPLTNTINGVQVADVFHLNAIDVDASGNLLVSSRAASAVYYVNKTTGTVIWKLGGTAYNKDGAQLISVVGDPEGSFSGQHDARFQPNGDVSMFDDHSSLPGDARGVEYALNFASSTASIVWSYTGPIASVATGSFRRYSDGTNLIDWGLSPNNPANFSEVDGAGNDLLDMSFGNHDSTYRTVKLPLDVLDLETLRITAGGTP